MQYKINFIIDRKKKDSKMSKKAYIKTAAPYAHYGNCPDCFGNNIPACRCIVCIYR